MKIIVALAWILVSPAFVRAEPICVRAAAIDGEPRVEIAAAGAKGAESADVPWFCLDPRFGGSPECSAQPPRETPHGSVGGWTLFDDFFVHFTTEPAFDEDAARVGRRDTVPPLSPGFGLRIERPPRHG